MVKKWGLWITISLLGITTQTSAHDLARGNYLPNVFSISIGPSAQTQNKNTETFYLQEETQRTFVSNDRTNALVDVELFYGRKQLLSEYAQAHFGLELALAGNANFSGSFWDEADPEFNNHTYNYTITHSHLAFKGRLLHDAWTHTIQPYVDFIVGLGLNHAYGFTNTPLIFEAEGQPVPNFASHTKAGLTYGAGIGLMYNINQQVQVGLGYKFTHLGNNQLGRAEGQTMNSGLTARNLCTNGLLFTLTYFGDEFTW